MRLEVLLFGITKDIIGEDRHEIELNSNTSVAELKKLLIDRYPKLEKLNSLLVAVNNEYGNDDLRLKAGDEIALIPPVSGG
ncbi:molybdopterin converting factor subunit 1 [Fulvivirga sp. RKSG066]|uniref:molybdopterin converting factor subunit 1 n=1 Tax=Fulvivirga aurantia TaxID=2529383 RepID=UPI0012BD7476|nr:molybdopterin converting factor subunit 1 [Fulvivirga aurantia]MTI22321.1 molybdopterin converting factor subunit 1 [Fulvivirga aurantia]